MVPLLATTNSPPVAKATRDFNSHRDLEEKNVLDIEDGVGGVHGSLVLGSLTNQTLLVGEGDERGGGEVTLLVGDDLDIGTLVGSHARVGGTCSNNNVRTIVSLR